METTDEIYVFLRNIMEHQDTNKKTKIRPMFRSLRMISFITGKTLRSDSESLPQMIQKRSGVQSLKRNRLRNSDSGGSSCLKNAVPTLRADVNFPHFFAPPPLSRCSLTRNRIFFVGWSSKNKHPEAILLK